MIFLELSGVSRDYSMVFMLRSGFSKVFSTEFFPWSSRGLLCDLVVYFKYCLCLFDGIIYMKFELMPFGLGRTSAFCLFAC